MKEEALGKRRHGRENVQEAAGVTAAGVTAANKTVGSARDGGNNGQGKGRVHLTRLCDQIHAIWGDREKKCSVKASG